MKKIVTAALLLSTVVAAPAFAAGAENLYVGAQVGSNSNGAYSGSSSTIGFGGLVGYTIDKNWAAEASYHLLGKSTFPGGDVTTTALAAHAVYTYPVNNQISVLGKIGFDSVSMKVNMPSTCFGGFCYGGGSSTASSSGLSYGVAAQYSVDKQIGVRAGFDVYTVSGGSINSLYVGGVYKF